MNGAAQVRTFAFLAAVALTGCGAGTPNGPPSVVVFTAKERHEIRKLSPLPPPPPSPTNAYADDPAAAHFGERLFSDTRLSADGLVSCATCHSAEKGFSDGLDLSRGIGRTDRHSQTLWNVAYNRWFFWDGRADSLWAQAIQPMLDKREMGATRAHLRAVIRGDGSLAGTYEKIFGALDDHKGDRLLANLGKAIAAHQRSFISNNSPFDRFVAALDDIQPGDGKHLDESARRGLQLFVGRGGCTNCHSGPNFSDGEFHNIGLPRRPDLPRDSGRFEGVRKVKADRFNGTGEFSDDRSQETNIKLRYLVVKINNLAEFKTPTLREVATTAPYMHDGRFVALREVFGHYSELSDDPPLGHREETLVPLELNANEMDDLEAFLRALTGSAS